jgi:fructose-1,6-bisphosphatase
MYGAGTKLILATRNGVDSFQLDDELGHFVLSRPNLQVSAAGQEYSVNEVRPSIFAIFA